MLSDGLARNGKKRIEFLDVTRKRPGCGFLNTAEGAKRFSASLIESESILPQLVAAKYVLEAG
jgi:hypothetical protein